MVKNSSLFDFTDYKKYLLFREDIFAERGFRTKLSNHAGCQPAFVTQVLSGTKDLSLEQAEKLNTFLNHSKTESHFFLLMVEKARAGTSSLRQYFADLMAELREKHLNLQDRLKIQNELTDEDKTLYYSSWKYGAVHISTTISTLNNSKMIAQRLRLDEKEVQEILEFLLRTGLVKKSSQGFVAGTSLMHLGRTSRLLESHHTQWRLAALQHFSRMTFSDIHYSAAVTLSSTDLEKIRSILIEAIDRSIDVVKPSPAEDVYVFNVDFFKF